VLLAEGEPDLMWKMLDGLCSTESEVIAALAGHDFERRRLAA
jgi:hypothetical protein